MNVFIKNMKLKWEYQAYRNTWLFLTFEHTRTFDFVSRCGEALTFWCQRTNETENDDENKIDLILNEEFILPE